MRTGGRQLAVLSPSSTQSTQLDESEIISWSAPQAPLIIHRMLPDEEDTPVEREEGSHRRPPAAPKPRGDLLHRISALFSRRRPRASAASSARERAGNRKSDDKQRTRSEHYERDVRDERDSPLFIQTQDLHSGRHSVALAQPLIVDPQYGNNNVRLTFIVHVNN